MNPIGSHKDRHQNIGYGTIGFDSLCNVIYNTRLEGIPFILETPWINRNQSNEYAPYKYEIDNFRKKKFIDFIPLDRASKEIINLVNTTETGSIKVISK